MADDALDDFFAKKDKSKKKSKTKAVKKIVAADLLPSTPPNEGSGTEEQVSQQVAELKVDDEPAQEAAKQKKKTKKKRDRDGADEQQRKEDEEWVVPEEEKDYSGLRIAAKSISRSGVDNANEDGGDSEAEYDEHGQLVPRAADSTNVWNTATAAAAAGEDDDDDEPVEDPSQLAAKEVPVVAELPNVTGGKYVPPSRRGQAAAGSSSTSRTADGDLMPISVKRPPRKKVAPNISSREDFPTLGSAPPPPDPDTSNFERVRSGPSGQGGHPRSSQPHHVETRNQFSALR